MGEKTSFDRIPLEEIRRTLAVDFHNGLTFDQVRDRQKRYGKNAFARGHTIGIFERIIRQLGSPLVFILIIAAVITTGLQKFFDTIVITIALLINVVVGVLQETRAGKAFEALARGQERRAIVLREGKRYNIDSSELVPGDIVLLEGGYQVPADARIFEEKDLRINESALTGEWLAVEKGIEPPERPVPLAEQRTMAWMGTLIESGYGKAVVLAIGGKTEVGKIAKSLSDIDESATPLQASIQSIARFLTLVVCVTVGAIFLLGIARSESWLDMFLLSVAVAVATVPSGLPAAVTVVLALGMEAILKRGGLVRNLLAAETLGATTIVLTDKTGTLTEAKMHLASVHTLQSLDRVALASDNVDPSRITVPDDRFLLSAAVFASDAFIDDADNDPRNLLVHGRPIEKAIILGALEEGIVQGELSHENRRLEYLPFDSARRFGASLNELPNRKTRRMYISGAPELLLARADGVYINGKREVFAQRERDLFIELLGRMSGQGKRLICAAYRDVQWDTMPELPPGDPREDLLEKITLIGVMVFDDPVRSDVPLAIKEVQQAGVRVVMITGDNPETARAIALKAGVATDADCLVIRGDEIEPLTDNALYELMGRVSVVARALPAQKLRIAQVLRNQGEVVAMTGDGINDAPALQAASIGIAVGSGTEVAKEASDMVLINNSFSIIVGAIEEGRRIIDNLKKILAYLLCGSFSEIFLISGALVAGVPLPLLPTQILWTKIVEEGLMSFSFAFEGKDPTAMQRSPREMESTTILSGSLRRLIVIVTVITGGFLIGLYFLLLSLQLPIEEVRTIMFVALSMDAIFFSFSLKSFRQPLWRINPFDNRFLLVALTLSVVSLILALSVPFLQQLLSLVPLTTSEILLLVGVGIFNLATIEIAKYFFFERGTPGAGTRMP
jgi:Ca2+-transporting ATPase